MKKAGRKVLAREQAAAAALEAERARGRAIEDAKEDLLREVREEEERLAIEEREQPMRERQLEVTLRLIAERQSTLLEDRTIAEEEEAWIRYMTCDGLPDPGVPSDMNTFMHHWTTGDEEADMTIVAERCDVVARLLSKLDDIVRFSTSLSERRAREYSMIGLEFRDRLYRWIDIGCYRVLRGLERNASREDSRMILRYVRASSRAVCCLWAPLPLPIGIEAPAEKERKPEEVRFEEIEATIKMPNDLDCDRAAIRALWLEQDRYSEEADTSAMPVIPENRRWESRAANLLDFSQKEYLRKLRIREEQREVRRARLEEKRAIIERMENPVAAPVERKSRQPRAKRVRRPTGSRAKPVSEGAGSPGNETNADAAAEAAPIDRSDRADRSDRPGTGGDASPPYLSSTTDAEKETIPRLPTPEEIICREEENTRRELGGFFSLRCRVDEINLRKYKILGGLFRVDLIQQPPQPKDLGRETFLTTLQLPKEPKFVDFRRPYEPPPAAPDSERTPEVIEEEMKALEAAMEALVLVTLKLPSSVLWIEPPLIAHWIPESKSWSTEDVHDVKYNEEKQTVSFRTGRLGVHGLAAYKFVHLPFQSWELKPETGRSARGGVVLAVTTATVQAEFIAREDLACLKSIAAGGSTALKGILGQFVKLEHLVENARSRLRPLPRGRRGELPQGRRREAPVRGETRSRVHFAAQHGVRILLVSMERDARIPRDSPPSEGAARLRSQGAERHDRVGDAVEDSPAGLHRAQPGIFRLAPRRRGKRVLRGSLSIGDSARRHQDAIVDADRLLQAGLDCRTASSADQRHRLFILTEQPRPDSTGTTRRDRGDTEMRMGGGGGWQNKIRESPNEILLFEYVAERDRIVERNVGRARARNDRRLLSYLSTRNDISKETPSNIEVYD